MVVRHVPTANGGCMSVAPSVCRTLSLSKLYVWRYHFCLRSPDGSTRSRLVYSWSSMGGEWYWLAVVYRTSLSKRGNFVAPINVHTGSPGRKSDVENGPLFALFLVRLTLVPLSINWKCQRLTDNLCPSIYRNTQKSSSQRPGWSKACGLWNPRTTSRAIPETTFYKGTGSSSSTAHCWVSQPQQKRRSTAKSPSRPDDHILDPIATCFRFANL